jgi:site-specific DNA recombinase
LRELRARLHVTGRGGSRYAYECTARIRGIRASAQCRPAPAIALTAADALVSGWFLARYGSGEVMRKIYDPGTGHAAQIGELEATRMRLREDRQAGLYDSSEDADWYRTEYRRLGEEITALKVLPERKPGMRLVPAGRTIAQEWDAADNARRREMLAQFEVCVVLRRQRGQGHGFRGACERGTVQGVNSSSAASRGAD